MLFSPSLGQDSLILAFPPLPGGQSINPESLVPKWGRDPPELGRDPPEFGRDPPGYLVVSPPTIGGVSPKNQGEYPLESRGVSPRTVGGDHLPRGPPQPEEGLAIHPLPPPSGEGGNHCFWPPPPPRGGSLSDGPPPPPSCGEGGWNPGGYA